MFKAALYLAVFYILYSLLLSRDTSYVRNRAFILITLLAALILPGITLQGIYPQNAGIVSRILPEVLIRPASDSGNQAFASGPVSEKVLQSINIIYIAGVILFLFRFMIDFVNLVFMIIRHKRDRTGIIRFHAFKTSGFSAMGYIFINDKLSEGEAAEIITHERNHLKFNHFLDIIFIEVVKAFQWFNPAVHLFNRSIRAIHEYQADAGCLADGTSVVKYQRLLLNQVFKSTSLKLTSSFSNPSLVRKRMIMMTRKRTHAVAGFKLLLVLPVTAFLFISFSAIKNSSKSPDNENVLNAQSQKTSAVAKEKPNETIYQSVDEMPQFTGGDAALLKYIGENTKYPEKAKLNGKQGRVVVKFVVGKDGSVSGAEVLKGVDPEIDAEAVRVISILPAFTPGRLGGKAVAVWYMVPITFALK